MLHASTHYVKIRLGIIPYHQNFPIFFLDPASPQPKPIFPSRKRALRLAHQGFLNIVVFFDNILLVSFSPNPLPFKKKITEVY